MCKSIILELDSYFIECVEGWLSNDDTHKQYKVFVLTKNLKHKSFSSRLSKFANIVCITYDDLFSYESKNELSPETYYQFNKYFLNDHLTARFLDRLGYYPDYGIGVQNAFTKYSFGAYNFLLFLKDNSIDFICFRNTPHMMVEWLLMKASEFLKIDTYTLEDFIFKWLYTIKRGCLGDSEFALDKLDLIEKEKLRNHIKNCVNINSGEYDSAIPDYEKKRRGKWIFKHYNPFINIISSLKRPHQIINKSKNYFFYKKWSCKPNLKTTDYVAFFLHYQPERSTLPEGYDFVDQFYTIKLLSILLPDKVKLLVKEHPSMFTKLSEPKARSAYNYELIKELKNVELVSMNTDSFSLIDNSLAVISIKGTVSLESYIRKKPVVMFGKTNLSLEGVHNFTDIESLQRFLHKVAQREIKIENVVDELTNACYGKVSSGILELPENVKSYNFTREIRENAAFPLLSQLLKNNLR